MSIKAIETEYNGYRFRSRLEARWAVFFDAVGMSYSYELEGIHLYDGGFYLPDFYLPWFNAWVEIKPKGLSEEAEYEAERKCDSLFASVDDAIVLLCKGDPVDMDMEIWCSRYDSDVNRYVPHIDKAVFVEGASWWEPRRDKNGLPFLEQSHDTEHWIRLAIGYEDEDYVNSFYPNNLIHVGTIRQARSFLEEDRQKARQARFEHGKTPRFRGRINGRT